MVHGIFFRDWQYFGYWGRVPGALRRNGAALFYGGQQSAAAVEQSARELQEQILKIVRETGCEKVNIIAHSKGGLDSRYAVSRLGMSAHVASLTTINTPHRGCRFVDAALKRLPAGLIRGLSGKYNATFKRLGDKNPDFYSGVLDLTAARCAAFNEQTPDCPEVFYQSVTSKMKSIRSAPLPLGLSYALIRHIDGENDGLVWVDSAKWGAFQGVLVGGRTPGVSHGDMIDLFRKNIPGFDVCEFYVDIVKGLKERGF